MYFKIGLGLCLIIVIIVLVLLKNREKYNNLPGAKLITYATHDQGMYQDLINNKFNIPVKTLGFGTKWDDFRDKIKGVQKYLETCNPDTIVIFLDGFDSIINKPIDVAIQRFLDYDTEILLSQDKTPHPDFLIKKIFGLCTDVMANSGLYMGYARSLKKFVNYVINKDYSTDDQRNFNYACQYFKNMLKVDTEMKIFKNLNFSERQEKNFDIFDTCFIQIPGELTFDRYVRRGFKEYYQFVKKESECIVALALIILFAIVAIIFFIKYFKNNPI
jgi:hypothetical protein